MLLMLVTLVWLLQNVFDMNKGIQFENKLINNKHFIDTIDQLQLLYSQTHRYPRGMTIVYIFFSLWENLFKC